MSNRLTLADVTSNSFKRADEITANDFDYGDGKLQRKRIAIAMNLMSLSLSEGDSTLKHLWTNNMLDDAGKIESIQKLRDKPTADADEEISHIWDHMDDDHKQMHINNHPESRFRVQHEHAQDAHDHHAEVQVQEEIQQQENHEELRERHRRRNRNRRRAENRRGREDEGDDSWWDRMTMEEQRKYLRDHPGSKKAKRMRIAARNLAMKAVRPIHNEVRKMGHDYKNGMAGLRAMRQGRKMTDEQKEGLKKTAKRVAVLLVGALAVGAMFTPLGPFAMEVGDHYMKHLESRVKELSRSHLTPEERRAEEQRDQEQANNPNSGDTTVGEVSAGVNLHHVSKPSKRREDKDNEMELEWMRRDMTEWLLHSDAHELAAKIKKNKR